MGYSKSSVAARSYREIVVFLPVEGRRKPVDTARKLAVALGVGSAELGVDALTGAVELRLFYDPALYNATREYLKKARVVFEIDRR